MCGIYGWSLKKKAKGLGAAQREALSTVLAIGNSMRGDQSWGAYLAGGQGPEIVRQVGDIARANTAWMGSRQVVMAHTRFATTGEVTRENAHPFTVGEITLAHNGVVFNHAELQRKHDRKCAVDSMHFAHHLAEGKDLSDVEGYGALEWVEAKAPTIVYLCRLTGGSLTAFGIRNEHGKQVGTAWSSDRAHLEAALGAARITSFPYEPMKEGQVYFVRDGKLMIDTGRVYTLADRTPSFGGLYGRYAAMTNGAWVKKDRTHITSTSGRGYFWDDENERWREEVDGFTPDEEEWKEIVGSDPDVDAGLDRLGRLTPVDGGMWVNEKGEIVQLDEAEERLWLAGQETETKN